MRRPRSIVMASRIGIFLGALILTAPTAASTAEKVQFETDYVITGKVAPFFMGLAKGFYKDEGLEVTINRGFGSARGAQDLVNKTVDYSFVDSIAGIVGMSRGYPVKYVSMIFNKPPYVVLSLVKSNIKTPKDLRGKKLAEPLHGTGRYVVSSLLSLNGMSPDDITWITTTPAGKNPALLTGKVDAIPQFTTGLPPLRSEAKKHNLALSVLHAPDWGVDVYSLGILTRRDRIQEKPDQVRRFVHASTQAWKWSLEHPDEMISLFKRYAPEVKPELARQEFDEAARLVATDYTKKHGLGRVDKAKMDQTIDFVTKHLKLKTRARAEDVYTNEFLPK